MGHNITSVDDDSYEENIPVIVMFAIFVIIGVLGNSLIIYIYGFRFQESTTRVFILSLAIFDFITCVLLPYKIVLLRYENLFTNPTFKSLEIIRVYFLQVSVMILPLVSVDRHRRICMPFKTQISPRMAKVMILIMCVILGSVTIFRLAVTSSQSGKYSAQAFVSSKYVNQRFNQTSLGEFYFLFTIVPFCIPLPVMVVMYFLIGLKVKSLINESKIGTTAGSSLPAENTSDGTILDTEESSEGMILDTEESSEGMILDTEDENGMHTEGACGTPASTNDKMMLLEAVDDAPVTQQRNDIRLEVTAGRIRSDSVETAPPLRDNENENLTDEIKIENITLSPERRQVHHKQMKKTQKYHKQVTRSKTRVALSRLLKKKKTDDDRRTSVELDLYSRRKHERALPWRRMTLIFFLITVVYFVSFLSFFIIFTIFRVNPTLGNHLFTHAIFIIFYNLVYVTSISNCLLYGFFDPRFRRELRSFKSSVSSSLHLSSKDSQ